MAEITLRSASITNMGFTKATDVPVVLFGDFDHGRVIAQIVRTQEIMSADDATCVVGFAINTFCRDPGLFDVGRSRRVAIGPRPHGPRRGHVGGAGQHFEAHLDMPDLLAMAR